MGANYLLRILIADGFVDVSVAAENDALAMASAIRFIEYSDEIVFELYDVRQEVARRVC